MQKLFRKKSFSVLLIFTLIFTNFVPVINVTAAETTTDDLLISEYIEGSSFNKAIELYNGTGEDVNLANYQLQTYFNGSNSAGNPLILNGTLENGEVYVIAHSSADDVIQVETDLTNSSVINFNGNDAVALLKDEEIIDVVGEIGNGADFGKDQTLVRHQSIASPSATYNVEEWEVYEKDTFSSLGNHVRGGESPEDPPTDPEVPQAVSVADARGLSDGTSVEVQGVVTVNSNSVSNGNQFTTYIQDETGGINIYKYEQGDLPELEKGTEVRVTGELETYNGLKEVVPGTIDVLADDQPLPEAHEITISILQDTSTAEMYEGELVQVNGYISSIPDSPAGGGYNISFMDEELNSTTLRVMENALDVSQIEEGNWYDVTAIVSQYNSYQLIPTEQDDFILAENQPGPPSAAGEYEATVDYVTDGDTIRIKESIFGGDRVRFLNMDTPETYAAKNNDPDREEINKNQKEHGDAATAYIKTLIKQGDTVTIKVGEEATDDYGRLLAEVITEDGTNVNLKMVEEGYASTYFIPPFNEEAYPIYQDAVKEAKDAGLGIWNPEDPLLELPFAFRANDDKKGFLRYVGNSDTDKYVVPEKWADVPVEYRVFFSSEEEAESYGYTPAGEEEPNEGNLQVQLLSMNDLHGKIDQQYELDLDGDGTFNMYGRMDYTAAAMKDRAQENPNTLLVHAGDMIGGSSPVSGLLQDEPTVEIMEEMGFDVGSVGNHEFDEGTEELLRMVNGGEHPERLGTEGYDGMNFPNLCANCVYKDSGDTILPPYYIEEVEGEKIGFIGVNTQASADMVMPGGIQDIEFTDEATAVDNAVEKLQAQGVEAIVVLAHIPADQDGDGASGEAADLAREVDDAVDVIFAAHNHQVVNGVVDDKLIVQASEYGKAFADVDLEIDRDTGDIVKKEAEIVFVNQDNYTPDPAVSAILDKYSEQIAPIMGEVIGYNATDLTGDYTNDGDHGLGNLIADGMNAEMESDFAMMNGGGIRDDLLAGEVTWGDLYNIQPFGNTLMTLEIKGADLAPIIQAQLSPEYGPDYSISGFHYTWDSETNTVVDVTYPDGSAIDPEETFTLTVNNYMGTSLSDKHRPISELGQNPVMGPTDLDATVNFVRSLESSEGNPFEYKAEGRISLATEQPGEEDPNENPQPGEDPNKDPKPGDDLDDDLVTPPGNDTGKTPLGDNGKGGSLLPKTATDMYNYLIAGLVFIVIGAGGCLVVYMRQRNMLKES
ncbi:5'-nucleotidase C-terminal domain-containing protein [Oceanobacillus manasiensis]|uniref:5'-nucleotidase C-terminal domain-containing protein n=1 Tax=Oceanobacillus manasiensis TaxID=586413 RepID=UPI00069445AA|nr:5'-nucleotidase C-terminal domain-containing protein [Oceanobacillus manasiensis]